MQILSDHAGTLQCAVLGSEPMQPYSDPAASLFLVGPHRNLSVLNSDGHERFTSGFLGYETRSSSRSCLLL